jgi:predicted enzyme related to lactoylglutathione lyase
MPDYHDDHSLEKVPIRVERGPSSASLAGLWWQRYAVHQLHQPDEQADKADILLYHCGCLQLLDGVATTIRFWGTHSYQHGVNDPILHMHIMVSDTAMTVPRLFRVILPVSNIDKAAEFYSQVLGIRGERVAPNRHYFQCGGTILACLDPLLEGHSATPNPEHIYFAVSDIEAIYERAKLAGCKWLDESVETQHWGERAFFAVDPFGNPICFVEDTTLFTGISSI